MSIMSTTYKKHFILPMRKATSMHALNYKKIEVKEN